MSDHQMMMRSIPGEPGGELMKVVYDPQIFSAQVYGGVSRYFCEIASRIAKEPGVQVSITAPMYINAHLERIPQGLVSGFRAPKTNHLRMLLRG